MAADLGFGFWVACGRCPSFFVVVRDILGITRAL
jgi:hypothetical protein